MDIQNITETSAARLFIDHYMWGKITSCDSDFKPHNLSCLNASLIKAYANCHKSRMLYIINSIYRLVFNSEYTF